VTVVGQPSLQTLRRTLDLNAAGREMYERVERLYPICRSITGNGVRQTLHIIGKELELDTREVPTGTRIFDWTVPQEWNIRDAYVKDRHGRRVIDFAASNLHVLNYSTPVDARLRFSELQSHLFSIPEHPDWIPYKTSYYSRNWGFCVTDRQRQALAAEGDDAEYEVRIESSIEDGSLTYGECFLPGRESAEVLFSSHVCHPSLCNDNLSGISVAVSLARVLATVPRRYSYRFLFAPGTVGAIAWLALNETRASLIRHGLVLACIGDRGSMTYKRSRRGTADIDRAVGHVLAHSGEPHEISDFSPYGYDERQYCSPGFNLPVGVLSRTPHGRFPEYHTSADNLDLVSPEALADSLHTVLATVEVLEGNARLVNTTAKCEPQLGRRGLYASLGGHADSRAAEEAMLWILNLADGSHTLLDIAERSGLSFDAVHQMASILQQHDLLRGENEPL
jgi:aminopeptidase-like protein